MKKQFEIPVCLLFFKRSDKILLILSILKNINAKKIYLLSDGARNEKEEIEIKKCRKIIEDNIDWDCTVVKLYSDSNVGVFGNIGKKALQIFDMEEKAIFLEDDNIPSKSFFYFCESMLEKYENDERVLWICGTNYLTKTNKKDKFNKYDYYFTQHLLPCGWASWSNKFPKYYDLYLEKFDDKEKQNVFKNSYGDKRLYKQQYSLAKNERERIKKGIRPLSWDYQMMYTIRCNSLYGVVPRINLIRNVGVDEISVHGGTTFKNPMTRRFCEVPNLEFDSLRFNGYPNLEKERKFEKELGLLILYPLKTRIKNALKKIYLIIFKKELKRRNRL